MPTIELPFRAYGLILTFGIALAYWVVSTVARKEKLPQDLVWDSLPWVLLPGLIGARLYHVIDLWEYYSVNLGEIIAVWQGGIGIFGALIGGAIGMYLYLRLGKTPQKLSQPLSRRMLLLLDLSVLGVPLAQAIGRWGNYVNFELYGSPTNFPWAIEIPIAYRLPEYTTFSHYHPLFLYESLLSLGLWLILFFLWKKRTVIIGSGRFLAVYLIGYGFIRTVLEPLRIVRWEIGSVPAAWIVSSILIITGVILVWRKAHD